MGAGNLETQNKRSQSPNRSFAHRAIMGGAADHQRSSSPLKRRASEIADEPRITVKEDVDMDAPASPEHLEDNNHIDSTIEENPSAAAEKDEVQDESPEASPTDSEIESQQPTEDVSRPGKEI